MIADGLGRRMWDRELKGQFDEAKASLDIEIFFLFFIGGDDGQSSRDGGRRC